MHCYKDRTFCPFFKDCADAAGCDRALTDEVWERAIKWWKGIAGNENAPVCQYAEKPDCHREGN